MAKICKVEKCGWRELIVNAEYKYFEKEKTLKIKVNIHHGIIKQSYIYNFDLKDLLKKTKNL